MTLWDLCLGRLVQITDGQLSVGTLPPLAGEYQPIRRIVLDSSAVQAGDVYWDIETGADGKSKTTSFAEQALIRGGLGAVVVGRRVEPWAGRFVLYVNDPIESLLRVIRCCPVAARTNVFILGAPDKPPRVCHSVEEELFSSTTRGRCPTQN